MMIFLVLWCLAGVVFTFGIWANRKGGEIFAVLGIAAPIYIWYALDIPYEFILGMYPVSALIFDVIGSSFCPMRDKCWEREEYEKRRAEVANADPTERIIGHIDLVKRGIR